MKKFLLVLVIGVALGGAFFGYKKLNSGEINDPIPSPQAYESATPSPKSSIKPAVSNDAMPQEVNLSVPFTIQAPHQNWEDPYGDFCEEASVLMAASYVKHLAIPDANFADRKMLEIKTFEEERFGYHKDTNAEETAVILREFYKIDDVDVVYDPDEEDIKKALADKKAIIIPAAGRELGNPNFRAPGPLYHMLVIKGYTKEGNFITNDPGTRNGSNYIYSSDVLMNAIHDWNGGDVYNGRKVMIVVG